MNKPKNRRTFITQSASVFAGLAATTWLSSCSSFDDYFFDDSSDLRDEVVIIGGGISGLYMASLLRQQQIEFRLYESSAYLGGRIRSLQGQDLGASILKKSDKLANELITLLKLERISLDQNHFYLAQGMQSMVEELKQRILGLLPYYSFRLRWKLIEINSTQNGYELTLENPNGQKKINCRHLVLSLPPSQWASVKGLLELPEMVQLGASSTSFVTENVIKFILPTSAANNGSRSQVFIDSDNLQLRQIYKKISQTSHLEIDVKHLSQVQFSIDYVHAELKRRLQINHSISKLSQETSLNWSQVAGVQGAYFKLKNPLQINTKSRFQLIGDSVALEAPSTLEGALQSAALAVKAFV